MDRRSDIQQQFYGSTAAGTAGAGAANGTDAYGNVQFSNPWNSPARAAAVNPTSAPYGLPASTMAPQSDLSALRATSLRNNNAFPATTGFATTYPDTQTAATTSPTAGASTYAPINGYGGYDTSNKNLQSSLVDYSRSGLASSYPSAEMDSARGMVHLSQNATRFSIPNGHRSSSSASSSSYYPHSTSSSISSASSYPYYGGSIDSSGADLAGLAAAGMYDDPSRPSLPRPVNMLHTMHYPATQQQMMHSFNSKVQQNTTKKHKCKVCDKRFTRPSSLQTHMYSHTGEKPFACEVEGCGRQFSVVSNLRRHRKVHKGHSDTETISNAGSV